MGKALARRASPAFHQLPAAGAALRCGAAAAQLPRPKIQTRRASALPSRLLVAMEDALLGTPGQALASAFSKLRLETPAGAGLPPFKASRRASLARTADERRLSAVQVPPSHPVSPAGSGGSDSPPAARASRRSPPISPPATSHFSIPAFHGEGAETPAVAAAGDAASTPPPAGAAPAAAAAAEEQRVTLSLSVHKEAATAAADPQQQELQRLREQLAGLQGQLSEARGQVAQLEAAAAGAAAEAVHLVINVGEAAGAAAPQQWEEQQQAAQPLQLVLQIVEPAAGEAAAAQASAGKGSVAELAMQLQRAEADREELARQAGQMRGRIAKVGGVMRAVAMAVPVAGWQFSRGATHACRTHACIMACGAPAQLHHSLPCAHPCGCSWRARFWLGRGASRRKPPSWKPPGRRAAAWSRRCKRRRCVGRWRHGGLVCVAAAVQATAWAACMREPPCLPCAAGAGGGHSRARARRAAAPGGAGGRGGGGG